ncbi:hypothetical protein Taro_017916 [Colocasia esculenta]|uniref:DYW domain-containing protein n=1 Tax=Colocasia esculenta TaxID=4460 RepID=A0A843USJ5_COLES|nr:hypothetical protein [Colocasia esculenta]
MRRSSVLHAAVALAVAAEAAPAARPARALQLLLRSASYPQLRQAHAHLLKSGAFPADTRLATKLLSLYSALRQFRDAALLLDDVEDPDPFCFSNLISALSKSPSLGGSARVALALFRRMLRCGLPPDCFVLPSVLKACAGLQSAALLAGRQVHALALASGLDGDPFVQTSLVHMYLRSDRTSDAQRVFDGMASPGVVPWSAMIDGYARRGCVGEALRAFDRMCESGVVPNAVTWNGMIAGFAANGFRMEAVSTLQRMHSQGFRPDGSSVSSVLPAIGDLEDAVVGTQVHAHAVKCGLESDGCVVSALVGMYGKCGCVEEMLRVFHLAGRPEVASCNALVSGLSNNSRVDEALSLFRELQGSGALELNVISWTSIIGCCSQNGRDVEALDLFREMQTVGLLKPNSVTIPCVLPACANIAALTHGKSCHSFSIRNGISEDVYVGSSLVDMYAKCGRIRHARRLFDAMPSRNVVSWNAMLGGYAMHGGAGDAVQLFDAMQRSGQVRPDAITFTCLLAACGQAGLTEQGMHYFDVIKSERHGIAPRTEHYACVVSLLGRAGKLGRAYAVIGEMPADQPPDACVWGALLSACKVHGDVALGEVAAEKLFELEPRNVGNYVLLSNIYAGKGMWDGVGRVRDAMRAMGLKKNPGYSWIQVGNQLHMLLAGDKSHPQMPQILERVEELDARMRRLGYLPSTEVVLQDVEEQDKEVMLCGHSEKLAVALGLLSTSPGTPLRVIKNLRICGDCHTVMKFVSRFEGREISVRDTNRFHHFTDGVCSCGDYW